MPITADNSFESPDLFSVNVRRICVIAEDAALRDALNVLLSAYGFDVLCLDPAGQAPSGAAGDVACLILGLDREKSQDSDSFTEFLEKHRQTPAIFLVRGLRAPDLKHIASRGSVLYQPFPPSRLIDAVELALTPRLVAYK